VFDPAQDKFFFANVDQQDGDATSGFLYPVPIPESGDQEAPKTFVNSGALEQLVQVPLAGTIAGGQSGGNNQYVFAVHFSGPTDSTPQLEAWDNINHNTAESPFLNHSGNSLIYAIDTTGAAPGSGSWAGTQLKGVTSRINLGSAAVDVAKSLYFNMKLVIPSTFSTTTYLAARLFVRFLYS
jgi:hypothetical protein